jgi:hypothetical protein
MEKDSACPGDQAESAAGNGWTGHGSVLCLMTIKFAWVIDFDNPGFI